MLPFNTITPRLLLLRQQAGTKVVSIDDSTGTFSGFASLMFLLSSSPETPALLPFSTLAKARADTTALKRITPVHLRECGSQHTLMHWRLANAHAHIKTVTSGNNGHERDTVELDLLVFHSSFDVQLRGGKGKQSM